MATESTTFLKSHGLTGRQVLSYLHRRIIRGLKCSSLCRNCKLAHIITFQFQKSFLPQNSASISCQAPARSDHPVARYDDADRIMPDRAADCLCGHSFVSTLLCRFVGNITESNREIHFMCQDLCLRSMTVYSQDRIVFLLTCGDGLGLGEIES